MHDDHLFWCGSTPEVVRCASLDVGLGQTTLVTTGQVYDAATVRIGGVLIRN